MKKKNLMSKLLIFVIAFFSVSFVYLVNVSADENDEDKQMEQFKQKVSIIKSIFGKSIDEVALTATVLHVQNNYQAVGSSYSDKEEWKDDFKFSINSLFNGGEISDNASDQGKIDSDSGMTEEQIDLLLATAIIMADSADWDGNYNQDKFKEALAGDQFIANDIKNGIFCIPENIKDGIINIGNTAYTLATGKKSTEEGWYSRKKICENGYIGGIYDITKDTESDPDVRKIKKEAIAQDIIDFIEYYKNWRGEVEETCEATTTGNFSSWKQYDDEWKNISVGNGGTIGSIGCLATSVAIQIARSGTQLTNVSGGFNPGTFVESLNSNSGFTGGGAYTWSGHQSIASNWKSGRSQAVSINNTTTLAKTLSDELSTGVMNKYQKFIVLQIHHSGSSEHWVAVDTVSSNNVTIFDPGAEGNTLDDNYNNWGVDSYRVMYATDVEMGKTGTSTDSSTNSCGGNIVQQIMEFIKKIEGYGYCNYKGQGEETGYNASIDSVDTHYVGFTTGYGITEVYNSSLASEVGYTTFHQDGSSGCTSREYVDKMAEKMFGDKLDLVTNYYSEKSGGKTLKDNQYVALVHIYNHYPVGLYHIIDEIANLDNYSYDVFASFMRWNGLGGSCGGYNAREVSYHVWYNGNYDAVRDRCAQPTQSYWSSRVDLYKNEQAS